MITNLTQENFSSQVAKAPGTHVISFWASWCKPCTMAQPIFMKVAKQLKDEAHFAEVNIDAQPDLARRFGIRSIPTVVVVKDGEAVDGSVGMVNQGALNELVKRNLG